MLSRFKSITKSLPTLTVFKEECIFNMSTFGTFSTYKICMLKSSTNNLESDVLFIAD